MAEIMRTIHSKNPSIPLFSDFRGMAAAGALACATLDYITPFVREGVTTLALNDLCHDFILGHGAVPAPLGYKGYPKSVCTSVNHVVCHGIPGEKKLQKGDSLNIDVTVILDGWYGDTGRMFWIPPILPGAARCMAVTYQALELAISMVKPGVHLGTISHSIQAFVQDHGFSVVREFCGHGIGRVFHGPPEVPHVGLPNTGVVLEEGMCFTIEPMVNMGACGVKVLQDGWTAVTRDRSLSVQYEHTLGVDAGGCQVFTRCHNPEYAPFPLDVT